MSTEYTQLKDIKLKDILDLVDGPFRDSCISQLLACGFIKKTEPEWQEITMRDLDKIRPGVTLKRIIDKGCETIIHVTSDPYWTSWHAPSMNHILVFKDRSSSGFTEHEDSINDLFNGKVYIQE
jgi:hypothetical protein